MSFVRYFLSMVGIIGFCCFMIFLNRCNTFYTPILYSVSRIVKDSFSSVDVGMIDRTTLKLLCTFMLISLSLCSLIDIFMHQSFRDS